MADQDTLTTDVLVIGSGPIGCTFARLLAPAGRTVVMLEAGAQFSPRPGEHLKNAFTYQRDIDRFAPIIRSFLHPLSVSPRTGPATALDPSCFRPGATIRNGQNPDQRPELNLEGAAASYAVGGMFTHWTNNTPRHHPILERMDCIPADEWDALYDHAERLLEVRCDVFRHSIRHTAVKEALEDHFAGRLEGPYGVQEMPVAGRRRTDNDEFVHYTGADTILGPLIDKPGTYGPDRFQILPQHRVKRLVHRAERVEYAIVHDLLSGRELRVGAEVFVVAAGSILTPQLLWASGIRPPALGRYLTEHPIAFTQVVLSDEIVRAIAADRRFADRVARVEADDPVPIPMHDPPPSLMIPISEERSWHCQVQRDSFSYGDLPPDVDTRLVVDLRWFATVEPRDDNRVVFDDRLNGTFGMPKPTFEFTLGSHDRERAHTMLVDMVATASRLGGFLPGAEPRFMPPGLALHFMGTYRMGGEDDGTVVTDAWSRVLGWENLYVGGNGLISTATASNPTLTSVALAIRSAQNILDSARSAAA